MSDAFESWCCEVGLDERVDMNVWIEAAFQAGRASAPSALPPGWKAVPIELTAGMIDADPYGLGYGRLNAIWSRLLSAAPPLPAQQEPKAADPYGY